jgi:hypothetical protein
MAYLDQYRLATDSDFRQRVVVAYVTAAKQIMAEAATVTGHAKRVDFANRVLVNPLVWDLHFSLAVVADTSISGASTDAQLKSVVDASWNGLANVFL